MRLNELAASRENEKVYHVVTEVIFLLISVAVFYQHTKESPLQNALIELYYIPIIIASIAFGWRWGLFYGLMSSLLSVFVLQGMPLSMSDWVRWISLLISVRIGMFIFIGAAAGYMAQQGRNREEGYRRLTQTIEAIQTPLKTHDEQNGLEQILDAAEALLKPKAVNRISIMLLDEHREYLRIVAARGIPVEIVRSTRQPVTKGIGGYVVQSGKPFLCQDFGKFSSTIELTDYEQGIVSSLCVPVISKENVVGVLCASTHSRTQPLDDMDLSAFVILGHAVAATIQNSQLYQGLKNSYLPTIHALAKAIDVKDKYTFDHSEKIAKYAMAVADYFRLSEGDKQDLYAAALLHDIGKIGVRDFVLFKPGKLTSEEYDEIKKHSVLGVKILEPLEGMKGVAKLVLYHQEKYDGTGYPYGLKGEEIPLGSRILSVVDAFHAMTSDRVYRKAMSVDWAKEELERFKGIQFDPKVVEAFEKIYDSGVISGQT